MRTEEEIEPEPTMPSARPRETAEKLGDEQMGKPVSRRTAIVGLAACGALAASGALTLANISITKSIEQKGVGGAINRSKAGSVCSSFSGLPEDIDPTNLCTAVELGDWGVEGTWRANGKSSIELPEGTYGAFPASNAIMGRDGKIYACAEYQNFDLRSGEDVELTFRYAEANPMSYDEDEARSIAEASLDPEQAESALSAFLLARAAAKTEGNLINVYEGKPEQDGNPSQAGWEVLETGLGWDEAKSGHDVPYEPIPHKEVDSYEL